MHFKSPYFTELPATGFYWLPGFCNEIKATRYSLVESYYIVNQNIVKNKVKSKITTTENYGFL